ncbi:MAG: transcription antitermination factor NusB [Clostridiales bacterium]|nr:transcription antitermination factor NusB [Clostridiales bacterium]
MSKTDAWEVARGRSGARELVMQLLFQMEAQNEYSDDIKTTFFKENLKDNNQKEYLEQMYALISEYLPAADDLIESCSENWKIDRMCKVDLAMMRTAVLEIMYMNDIPESVSVNEAVDIAKKYGTEDSGKFVNGVLGKVVKMKHAN